MERKERAFRRWAQKDLPSDGCGSGGWKGESLVCLQGPWNPFSAQMACSPPPRMYTLDWHSHAQLFPPLKATWYAQHWMLWRLMRFGWLAFYLLCSSRTTVDLLRCTWVRLQWDVARCILSERVRLVHLSVGQLRHQLSSSLLYRDLGWEPADRLKSEPLTGQQRYHNVHTFPCWPPAWPCL